MGQPSTSSALKPNSRCALALQLEMSPRAETCTSAMSTAASIKAQICASVSRA